MRGNECIRLNVLGEGRVRSLFLVTRATERCHHLQLVNDPTSIVMFPSLEENPIDARKCPYYNFMSRSCITVSVTTTPHCFEGQ
jgi:hypothetical protein